MGQRREIPRTPVPRQRFSEPFPVYLSFIETDEERVLSFLSFFKARVSWHINFLKTFHEVLSSPLASKSQSPRMGYDTFGKFRDRCIPSQPPQLRGGQGGKGKNGEPGEQQVDEVSPGGIRATHRPTPASFPCGCCAVNVGVKMLGVTAGRMPQS